MQGIKMFAQIICSIQLHFPFFLMVLKLKHVHLSQHVGAPLHGLWGIPPGCLHQECSASDLRVQLRDLCRERRGYGPAEVCGKCRCVRVCVPIATWALRYFLHCLLSALYNSCISAVLIPHPKRQWVWINDFEMNIESTASCRNKCGVWTVADFTSENEHNSLRWQLYDCHGRRGMNDQVYSWALLCPMRAPKWQAAYLHMCTRASSLIFEWFKLSAPVITAANSFPIKMRNQTIVNIKGWRLKSLTIVKNIPVHL